MSQIARLVRIDQALHGHKFTLVEFWGAFGLAGALAVLSIAHFRFHGPTSLIGISLAGIALNYLPLAIRASRAAEYPRLRRDEINPQELRRMTVLSGLLIMPFAVLILGIV